MSHAICFIAGAAVATAACVIMFGSWRQPDKSLVIACRERVTQFRALSEADKKVFLDSARSNPGFHTRWKATCVLNNAFGGAPINLPD